MGAVVTSGGLRQRTGTPACDMRQCALAESARQSRHPLWVPRKVRAPQGKVPGNAWAAQADGKCNRKIPPNAPAAADTCRTNVRPSFRTTARLRQEAWQG